MEIGGLLGSHALLSAQFFPVPGLQIKTGQDTPLTPSMTGRTLHQGPPAGDTARTQKALRLSPLCRPGPSLCKGSLAFHAYEMHVHN